MSTEGCGRAGDGDRVASIVDLGVMEADSAGDLPRIKVGRKRLGLVDIEALGSRHGTAITSHAAQGVVETHAGSDVRALPPPSDGEEKRDGSHEMRGQSIEQEPALREGLMDERELALLEIAETTVCQARRARRRASCEIALLDEGDGESACCRIECSTAPDDSATDDDDVDVVVAQVGDRPSPRSGAETIIRVVHDPIVLPRGRRTRLDHSGSRTTSMRWNSLRSL